MPELGHSGGDITSTPALVINYQKAPTLFLLAKYYSAMKSEGPLYGPIQLQALDYKTLTLNWSEWATADYEGQDDLQNQPVFVRGPDRELVIVTTDYGLKGFDAKDGSEMWRVDVSDNGLVAGPTIAGENVILFRGHEGLTGSEVICVKQNDGKVVWRTTLGPPAFGASPVATKKYIVVPLRDFVVLLDAEHGKEVWRTPRFEGVSASPTVAHGLLFVIAYPEGAEHPVLMCFGPAI